MDELVARETVDLLPYVSWEKDVIEEKVEFSRRKKVLITILCQYIM